MANPPRLRPLLPLMSGQPLLGFTQHSAPKRKRPQVPAACNGIHNPSQTDICNGVRPTCHACSVSKKPCVYPVPEGLSQREAQKQKFTRVERAHENSRRVLEMLRASRDGVSNDILQQLQHSEHLDEAIQAIADASLLLPRPGSRRAEAEASENPVLEAAGPTRGSAPRRLTGSSGGSPVSITAETPDAGVVLPVSRWTTVSQDDGLLTTLIDHFWTWDDTLSRLIDRDVLLAELTATGPEPLRPDQQTRRFCSPLLVNALLAVSCLHATRKLTNSREDLIGLAQSFADHAFDLLEAESAWSSLTLLQAAAILWVYASSEGSHRSRVRVANLTGLMQRAWASLELGDSGPNVFGYSSKEPAQGTSVWRALSSIAWGFYCFFAKMALVEFPYMLVSRPLVMKTFESLAAPSAGSQSPASSDGVSTMAAAYQQELLSAECWLCEIAEQLVSGFIKDGNRRAVLDAGRCTALYNKLLCWKLSLPDHLATSNSVSSPVLLLYATYDFVALKLLFTFTDRGGTDIDGRNAAALQLLHASSLTTNLWIYRGLYALRHEYWAGEQCHFVARSLLLRLAAEPGSAAHDIVGKACCVLRDLERDGASGRAGEMLREVEEAARAEGVRIPAYGSRGTASPDVIVRGARVFDGASGGLLHVGGSEVRFAGTISGARAL
ncbi:nitrogen assimilation transcription factor nira [Colletotrichum musicola]|uniref:Nitrogen assimilation transcription factor nira n=1 Tax=Colletotrichum musicola TaxID=2175873 RepID=A0A8H6JCC3_9PEZI|nr:nitrogen assimilation transcription factor nira [Colletotrichum musicola]